MRDHPVVRRYSSGVTGRVTLLTAEGSSRSLRYNPVSLGWGTLRVASRKPGGTGAVVVNCGSDATESIKYKLLPISWHGLSGVAGQRISFRTGRRTSTARGCQSPFPPSELTARNCRGPNAEAPKAFSGSRVATRLSESRNTRLPSAKLRTVLKDSLAVATSIFWPRENLLGISVCNRNEIWPSSGSSSWLARLIVDCAAPGRMFFLYSATFGRGS